MLTVLSTLMRDWLPALPSTKLPNPPPERLQPEVAKVEEKLALSGSMTRVPRPENAPVRAVRWSFRSTKRPPDAIEVLPP